MPLPGTVALDRRKADEHQQNDPRHMEAHVPVVDGHTGAGGDVVVGRKKNRKPKSELYQPGAEGAGVQAGIVLLFQLLGLFDVELRHTRIPVTRANGSTSLLRRGASGPDRARLRQRIGGLFHHACFFVELCSTRMHGNKHTLECGLQTDGFAFAMPLVQ